MPALPLALCGVFMIGIVLLAKSFPVPRRLVDFWFFTFGVKVSTAL